MRNKTIRSILEWHEKYMPEGRGRIHSALNEEINNGMKALRKAHRDKSIDSLYEIYGWMVFNIVGWIWSRGLADVEDYAKNSELAVLGSSHMDLLLSYIEDFVGGNLLDEIMTIIMDAQNKRQIVDIEGVKSITKMEAISFSTIE